MHRKFLALLCVAGCAMAWAHGGAEHAKPAKTISTEQHDFGREGNPRKVSRTIRIDMLDSMRYRPGQISVKQGEVIRLVLINRGAILHEAVLGNEAELKAHAEQMRKFPEMEYSAPYMTHVAAGKRQEIVWEFNRPGKVLFGCLMPGHFEAGMVGSIEVQPLVVKLSKE